MNLPECNYETTKSKTRFTLIYSVKATETVNLSSIAGPFIMSSKEEAEEKLAAHIIDLIVDNYPNEFAQELKVDSNGLDDDIIEELNSSHDYQIKINLEDLITNNRECMTFSFLLEKLKLLSEDSGTPLEYKITELPINSFLHEATNAHNINVNGAFSSCITLNESVLEHPNQDEIVLEVSTITGDLNNNYYLSKRDIHNATYDAEKEAWCISNNYFKIAKLSEQQKSH